jgi:hypothetical protein
MGVPGTGEVVPAPPGDHGVGGVCAAAAVAAATAAAAKSGVCVRAPRCGGAARKGRCGEYDGTGVPTRARAVSNSGVMRPEYSAAAIRVFF